MKNFVNNIQENFKNLYKISNDVLSLAVTMCSIQPAPYKHEWTYNGFNYRAYLFNKSIFY